MILDRAGRVQAGTGTLYDSAGKFRDTRVEAGRQLKIVLELYRIRVVVRAQFSLGRKRSIREDLIRSAFAGPSKRDTSIDVFNEQREIPLHADRPGCGK